MPVAGELLLGRYRVLEVRAGVVRAAEGAERVLALAAPLPAGVAADPESILAEQDRYRIGADAILRALGSSALGGELVVAYAERDTTTVASWIREGNVRPDRVAALLTRLGEALAPLHDQGIAHGHLRPETISIAEDGRVHLTGFGFAAILDRVAGARAAAEALPPPHRAPESNALTPAHDVFALGVMVRELCGEKLSPEVEKELARWTHESPLQRPDDVRHAARRLAEALVEQGAAPKAPPPAAVAPPIQAEPLPVEPPQPAAPPPVEPPPAPRPPPPAAFAPPESKRGAGGGLWPIFALLGGVVLMIAGIAGLFAFAMLRSPSAAVAPPTVATVTAPFPTAAVPDAGVPEFDAGVTSGDGGELAIEAGDGGVPSLRFTAVDDGSGPLPVPPDAAIWGDKGALVTILWFGDLECPHTRNSYRVIEAVLRAFSGEVRVAWRHRPLSVHPRAKDAARVLAGVRKELGDAGFWRFVSAVSGDAREADRARLEQWVERAGAEPIRVSAWLASRDTEREVERDLELAGTFDVRATPTFFVNGLRVEGTRSFDDMKAIVQKELAAARGLAALGTEKSIYAARVRKNLTGLGADVAARTCPVLGSSPARGASDALVTIVEFSDFECQFCKQAQPTLDTLLARFGGDVRHVWKNFPLSMHPRAVPAANFALEARKHGGDTTFWKVHDLLFAEQKSLADAEGLESIAKRAGLPPDRLLAAVQSQAHKAAINADMEQGKRFGVRGTPSFFVNGRQIAGALPLDKFQAVVTEELETARRLVKSGTPRSRVYDAVCGAR